MNLRWLRSLYRRTFYPNGPAWFGLCISSAGLYFALEHRKPSQEELRAFQKREHELRLKTWHQGF